MGEPYSNALSQKDTNSTKKHVPDIMVHSCIFIESTSKATVEKDQKEKCQESTHLCNSRIFFRKVRYPSAHKISLKKR
jgi:hypothetical protein